MPLELSKAGGARAWWGLKLGRHPGVVVDTPSVHGGLGEGRDRLLPGFGRWRGTDTQLGNLKGLAMKWACFCGEYTLLGSAGVAAGGGSL